MFEFAALTYGMIVTFVMASTSRNHREARTNPPLLTLFGWTLMTFSGTTGLGLLGYCGYHVLMGAPVAI